MPGSALLIANLDGEIDLAREAARTRTGRGDLPPAPPPAVRRPVSALGTLFRALALDGDQLWTPEPVPPARLAESSFLPRPRLACGPLEELHPGTPTLAWIETPQTARLRKRTGGPASARDDAASDSPPLTARLRRLPAAGPEAALRANDRAFALELAKRLGTALPGSVWIDSTASLETLLRAGRAERAPEERWVLKAPWSSAARNRLRGRGRFLDAQSRGRVRRLLEWYGRLLFEPWLEKAREWGVAGMVTEAGVETLGTHLLLTDRGGHFRGVSLETEGGAEAPPEGVESAARASGEALFALGYRGPFGIDARILRDAAGREHFVAPAEINARFTFGHIAHVLRERALAAGYAVEPGIRLRVGRGDEAPCEGHTRGIPLLAPETDEPTAAWLEIAT